MQDSQEKLQQEKETPEGTIKSLVHRLYRRRSERLPSSPDQLPLDFGDGEVIEVVPDVSADEAIVEEYQQKRRRRKKPLGDRFPDDLPRRTERIEPELPKGIRREDCELICVDVVEILDCRRSQSHICSVLAFIRQGSWLPGGKQLTHLLFGTLRWP